MGAALSGEAPPDYFIGPTWCLDKPAVKLAIDAEMQRRDTWQGKAYSIELLNDLALRFNGLPPRLLEPPFAPVAGKHTLSVTPLFLGDRKRMHVRSTSK